jgi:hypothetical protein
MLIRRKKLNQISIDSIQKGLTTLSREMQLLPIWNEYRKRRLKAPGKIITLL